MDKRASEVENFIVDCCKKSSIYYEGERHAVKYLCDMGIVVYIESSRMLDCCEVTIPNYNSEVDEPIIRSLMTDSSVLMGCESHSYRNYPYCLTFMLNE